MRMQIQLTVKKLCKNLPYEEFAVVEKKIAQKGKTMELVQIFVKNLNKIQLIPIFLNFVVVDFFSICCSFSK